MRRALVSEELVTLLKSALASGSTRRALVSEPLVTLEKSAFFPSSCWTPLLGSSRRSRGSLREGLMPGSVAMGAVAARIPRRLLTRHCDGVKGGGRYWRGSRPGGGGARPGVARHGLMSSPPRRV